MGRQSREGPLHEVGACCLFGGRGSDLVFWFFLCLLVPRRSLEQRNAFYYVLAESLPSRLAGPASRGAVMIGFMQLHCHIPLRLLRAEVRAATAKGKAKAKGAPAKEGSSSSGKAEAKGAPAKDEISEFFVEQAGERGDAKGQANTGQEGEGQ